MTRRRFDYFNGKTDGRPRPDTLSATLSYRFDFLEVSPGSKGRGTPDWLAGLNIAFAHTQKTRTKRSLALTKLAVADSSA